MGLGLRFNIILAACYLVGLGLSLWPFYQLSRGARPLTNYRRRSTSCVRRRFRVRKYTSEEIQPLLADQSAIQFLPRTIPSFSAQTVFRNFRKSYPEFFYKEAALNPTNPADLAKDWEQDLIEKLSANRDLRQGYQTSARPTRDKQYTVTYPLVIKDESCLICHSTPDKAPASMVALYGPKNGFGWKLNDTIVAQIISIPMSATDAKVWRNLMFFVGISTGIFLVLLVLLNLLLNRYVISPVNRMAKIAEAYGVGDTSVAEFEYSGSDEVASLSRSFNRMRRSLDSAMKMLDK